MGKQHHKVAVIPGDGIGQEVIPAALTVLEAAASRGGFYSSWSNFPMAARTSRRTAA